jgi:hypothetical protein
LRRLAESAVNLSGDMALLIEVLGGMLPRSSLNAHE